MQISIANTFYMQLILYFESRLVFNKLVNQLISTEEK